MVAGAGLLLAFVQPDGRNDHSIGERWDSLTHKVSEYLRPAV